MIRGSLLAASVAAALRLPAPATAQQQTFPGFPGAVCKASCAGPPPTSVIGFNKPITLYGYTLVPKLYEGLFDGTVPVGCVFEGDGDGASEYAQEEQVFCQGERGDGQRPGGRSVYRCRPSVCATVHTRTLAHHLAHTVLGPLRVCYLLRRS